MLSDRHLAFLRARAVSDAVIARRGYRTITDPAELEQQSFSPKQAKRYVPGLLIPRYGLNGRPSWPKFRPDQEGRNGPLQNRDGKVIKYASPAGAWNFVDVLPGTRLYPGSDIWVSTEGFVKADAMVSLELPAVAIDGIWGWRSQGEMIPGLEVLSGPGWRLHLICDSDFGENPMVAFGVMRLAKELRQRGSVVDVRHPPGADKVGIDDHLAADGSVLQLVTVDEQDAWRRARNQGRSLRILSLLRSSRDESTRRVARFTH